SAGIWVFVASMAIAGPKNAPSRRGSRTSSTPMLVSMRTSPCAAVSSSRQWLTRVARPKRRPSPFTARWPPGHHVQQSRGWTRMPPILAEAPTCDNACWMTISCYDLIQMRAPLETVELLSFTEAVEAGSLSRAAAQLNVPRATLGRRLARLEERVGARLL